MISLPSCFFLLFLIQSKTEEKEKAHFSIQSYSYWHYYFLKMKKNSFMYSFQRQMSEKQRNEKGHSNHLVAQHSVDVVLY